MRQTDGEVFVPSLQFRFIRVAKDELKVINQQMMNERA